MCLLTVTLTTAVALHSSEVMVTVPSFSGLSFLCHSAPTGIQVNTNLVLSFIPTTATGILIYIGNTTRSNNFLSLSIINQYIELRYDLGSGLAMLVSPTPVALGACHTVSVSRVMRAATLSVNGTNSVQGQSPGTSTELNSVGNMFLGGVESSSSMSASAGTGVGFSGCITALQVSELS